MLNISKVLQGRALAELAAGRPENAFQDVQTILAVARAAGSPPLLITVLVENSILDRASQVIRDGLERYAWSDAPIEANLYNGTGLPAGTFRTDDWPAITRDGQYESVLKGILLK
jgi:hypothetical protein